MMLQMLMGLGPSGSIVPSLGGTAHGLSEGFAITVSMSIQSDGAITATTNGDMVTDTINGDLWFTPVTPGIGANYWVRATVTSGSFSSGIAGTWLNLGTSRSWSRSQNSIGSSTVQFTIDIASDSAGSNIVATGSFTLTAQFNPAG